MLILDKYFIDHDNVATIFIAPVGDEDGVTDDNAIGLEYDDLSLIREIYQNWRRIIQCQDACVILGTASVL